MMYILSKEPSVAPKIMMLKCFNCGHCMQPFDSAEDMPRTPVLKKDLAGITCASCRGKEGTIITAWGLIDLLNEAWLEKTQDGYIVCGHVELPTCPECSHVLTVQQKWCPILLPCGHICCYECCKKNTDHACAQCAQTCNSEQGTWGSVPLLKLINELALKWREKFESDLKTIDVQSEAVQIKCADCAKEEASDRMFRCFHCPMTICGFCAAEHHQKHDYQKLSKCQEFTDDERLEKGLAIILKCFNCPTCHLPYDAKIDRPNTPMYRVGYIVECAACVQSPIDYVPQLGLMEILDKSSMTKMDQGYLCVQAPTIPKCPGCKQDFSPYVTWACNLGCGHLLCGSCQKSGTNDSNCSTCQEAYNPLKKFFNESLLQFFDELAQRWSKNSDAIQKQGGPVVVPVVAIKCNDCAIEQPLERLLNCIECSRITCGFCYIADHMNHQFEKLYVTKLRELESTVDKRLEMGFVGLQGIIDGLHEQMKKRMGKLLTVATSHRKLVGGRPKYGDGQQIAADVGEMATNFERRCENYIPLIRSFSDKLVDWTEELEAKHQEVKPGTSKDNEVPQEPS